DTRTPEQALREAWYVAHADARADHRAAWRHRAQRCGNQLTGRGEDDGGVQRLGPGTERVAGPLGSERPGEGGAGFVCGAHEGEDPATLMARHLDHEVSRRPEAVEAQAL